MSRPLQVMNAGELNTRHLVTPVKASLRPNYDNGMAAKRTATDGHDQPQKKKKEKLSALCKTPPSLIKNRGRDYRRGVFLGEGGFARCFQMKDDSGKVYAAKTVAKASIKSEKTKKKLLSEIQIHKCMKHTNIVEFIDCFEDDVNVYILLEICPNGSLMELLKKRKMLSEPEVRFFMTQVIGGIAYMHERRVIHRDLKLGNIFFDEEYNLKIGDFGLAAVLSSNSERKYTVCGTPNYIAPEVLAGKTCGHSYEVDIWSIGVMIYALLVGKPPFQSKEVSMIYERIKTSDYHYPREKPISPEAMNLIDSLLSTDPLDRPLLGEVLNHPWFTSGLFPRKIESNVMDMRPDYTTLTMSESRINFKNAKVAAGLMSMSAFSNSSKNPVELVKADLQAERPKSLLPQSLSPNNTREKYREVVDPSTEKRLQELQRQARLRKANTAASSLKALSPISSNAIKSEVSLQILASECQQTLQGIREAEMQSKMGGLSRHHLPPSRTPILITKWVDYSNKHGFSYQLSTDDIGVLFNSGTTVLRLADAEEFWYITFDNADGWVASHYALHESPRELGKHLEILDFFSNYMKANLSRVSNSVREDYHSDDVFLRRYTRYQPYVMFELSDGTFQFNFKNHHKFAVSDGGKLTTYISPDRTTQTIATVELLTLGYVPGHKDIDLADVFRMIKEGLSQKSQ